MAYRDSGSRTARTGARAAWLLAGLVAGGAAVAASAPDPGDYIPAPPGIDAAAIYLQHLAGDAVYARGRQVADGLGFRADILAVRGMRFFEVGGKVADVEIVVPFARQHIDDGARVGGVGNLVVGASYWTHNDEAAGRYGGFAAYLTLPTSNRTHDAFVVGEDRYALEFQAGQIVRLAERWSLDAIGQVEFYTPDGTTRAHRAPLVRGIAHLNYHVSPDTRLALSLRQAVGARERIDGETVLGNKNDTNLMLTWAHQFNPNVHLLLQYASDVAVREGPAIDAVQSRLVLAF